MWIKNVNQRTRMPSARLPAVLSFGVWTLTAAAGTAWVLALWPTDQRPVATVAMGSPAATDLAGLQADIGKVLGRQPEHVAAEPALASRLGLWGVAQAGSSEAVALISVDGQTPKPVRRGSEVQPGLMLQSVTVNEARLGSSLNSAPTVVLPMPKRPEPLSGQAGAPVNATITVPAQPRPVLPPAQPLLPGNPGRVEPPTGAAEPRT